MMIKTVKKAISALLVLAFLAGAFPLAEAPTASAFNPYIDVSGHWGAGSINRWNGFGFIDPAVFSGDRFQPDKHITRVEFFSLIVHAMGATSKADITGFSDLADTPENLRDVIALANQMGIAFGNTDGTMRPNSNLLRQDAATLAARAIGMSTVADWTLAKFHDGQFVSPYARTYVAAFVEKGLMNGYPDGTIRPSAFITRAEAVRLLDNLFTHVYAPETGMLNLFLKGGVLVRTPGAELRDSVIEGDVIIGDGVGNSSVVIRNCEIKGRVVVRGGGPNTVTISNTRISDGLYIASFGADTHVSVTDNSTVPVVEAVSNCRISGSGVAVLTILENARKGAEVNLEGVSLDELNIGGNGAKVTLLSGYATNARFDEAGQGAALALSTNTVVNHLTIAAPNAVVSGAGSIRNLTINNAGAVVAPNPDFLTLGLNIRAVVNGQPVASAESQWTNSNIDRVSSASNLKVELIPNTSPHAPFDQTVLNMSMVAGGTAAEAHVSQSAASRVPLTQRGERLAFWVGFFVPAPPDSGDKASVTYTYADGAPITVPPRALDAFGGRQGLILHLPVFREPGKETGTLKEVLHINWGGHLTENIVFRSTTMHLAAINATQRAALQRNFDNRIFHSIQPGMTPYTGAEATRRILASDNPLGLPTSNNRGLLSINRAVSVPEARAVLEDPEFAADLTIDTSGTSQYSALSDAGKNWVTEQVLAARKTLFATPASVKAAFDKAVQTRLSAETTLLGQINGSADPAALRRIIEIAGNAALLQFQTGADPYRIFSNEQRDNMAKYLWDLRQYRSIQEVIDAIRKYLGDPLNTPRPPAPDMSEIIAITTDPKSFSVAAGSSPFSSRISVTERLYIGGPNSPMTPDRISQMTLEIMWVGSNNAQPAVTWVREGDTLTFTPIRQGSGRVRVTHPISGKYVEITINVGPAISADPTYKINFTQNDLMIFVGQTVNLRERYLDVKPANATDLTWNSTNSELVSVNSEGIIVAGPNRSPEPAVVSVTTSKGDRASINVWVFASEFDVFASPNLIHLQAGSSSRPGQINVITASPVVAPNRLRWESLDPDIASVGSLTGIISVSQRAAEGDRATIRVWFERNTGVPLSPTAYADVTVFVRALISFNVTVRQSIIENRGRDGLPYGGEAYSRPMLSVDPIGDDPFLPEVFIWHSSNPVILFTIDGGKTVNQTIRTGTSASDMPQIVTNGIGRSTITLRTSEDGQPGAVERYIISAPRGVSGMEFYLGTDTKPMTDDPNFGREIIMLNGGSQRVRAVEEGQPARDMAWIAYQTDKYRSEMLKPNPGDKPRLVSGSHLVNYNTSTSTLRATDWGLARVVVTPTVANVPPGWGMTLEDQRGRWYGRGNMPLFVPEYEQIGGDFVFVGYKFDDTHIDVALSGLRLRDSTGFIAWSNLDAAKVEAGTQVVCDVNGQPLTDVNWNPVDVPLVVTTADALGSNELYVWIQSGVPTIRVLGRPTSEIILDRYRDYWALPPENLVIAFEVVGGFTYDSSADPVSGSLSGPRMFAASSMVNTLVVPTTSFTEFQSIIFGVNAAVMPKPDEISPPFPITYRSNIAYTSNEGFVEKLSIPEGFDPPDDPGDPAHIMGRYRLDRLSLTDPANPTTYTFTVVQNPSGPVELTRTLYRGDPDWSAIPDPNNPYAPDDFAWFYFASDTELVLACGMAGIDLNTANMQITTAGLTFPGELRLEGTGAGRKVIGVRGGPVWPSPVLVIIRSATDSMVTVTVRFNILEHRPLTPPPWYVSSPFASASAPIVGFDVPIIEVPGILAAATSAGIAPANAVFESADASVLSIDSKGVATPRKAGKVNVTIKERGGSRTARVTVEVKAAAPSAIPSPTPGPAQPAAAIAPTAVSLRSAANVAINGTMRLEPFVTPYNADRAALKWSSSDATVATVSETGGIVTGFKAGSVKITVASADGAIKAECTVTVKDDRRPVSSISLNPKAVTLNVGATRTPTVSYKPSNATLKSVTWSSNNSSVARVEPNGKIVAISAGTAVITATSDSGAQVASCTVTVKVPVKSVTLPERSITIKVGETYQLVPVIDPTNATVTGAKYTTKSKAIASVSPEGLITGAKAGSTTITVSIDGKSVTCSVKVVR